MQRSSIDLHVGKWSRLGALDEDFDLVGADLHAVSSSCSLQSFCESLEFFAASQQIDVISKLQSRHPPIDIENSGVSISSASYAASSTKHSFSDGC